MILQNSVSKGPVVGVYFDKPGKRWRAHITVKTKRIYLGVYVDKNDAIRSRKKAEIKYLGKLLDKDIK